MSESLNITVSDLEEDRFHRFRLISWWDQDKLRNARVLVIGAGALGNEIIKNLALLGIGNVLVADMDRIEHSNLSRSVLYRASDNGAYKANVAAAAAREIYPDQRIQPFNGNVVYDLGLGVYRWADLVIGGLDNREARLSINRACWKLNKPWIDGAIQQIDGVARVFIPETHPLGHPDAPCYECTMSETDWKLLQNRRSCNLLSRGEMEAGKTPTTPTISSIIAGLQCQEAVKLLHGLETLSGRGWVFNGLSADSYTVAYQRKANCYSHEMLEQVVALSGGAATMTVSSALAEARKLLGESAELELPRDVLHKLRCGRCGREEELFISLGKAKAALAVCGHCPGAVREVVSFHRITGKENFLHRTLAEIGVPLFDILIARNGDRAIGLELAADAATVLGELASDESDQLELI